jgi:hypothetical protein
LKYIGESHENPEIIADLKISKSCDDILSVIKDQLYSEQSEPDVESIITNWVIGQVSAERGKFKANKEDRLVLTLHDETIKKLRYHFEALGLVTSQPDYRSEFSWRLTDRGRTYVANMYAFKKPAKA